jgi:sugar O-acyltransferase (sialic acid O-acetyltransferase NeuD family)
MTEQGVVIVGTGGHAQVMYAAYQCLQTPKPKMVGWLEHEAYVGPDHCFEYPVFTSLEDAQTRGANAFYFGLGMVFETPERWDLFLSLCQAGLSPVTLMHPTAIVATTAEIHPGCFVSAGAIVQPFALVREACIINTGAIVEHHVTIGKNTHVGPGAVLCGNVAVGQDSMIGAGATVIQSCRLGDRVAVGAGSTVIRDLPQAGRYVGSPAVQLGPRENVNKEGMVNDNHDAVPVA